MKKMTNQAYNDMIKDASPPSKLGQHLVASFCVGGLICVIGQFLQTFFLSRGMEEVSASSAASISLIFIAALLTAMNVFDDIAAFAGAGTLVPITGFSNATVSPAMEFKTEGLVLGVGAKMFTISGPVIVYGTVSSILAGIVYYCMR